MEPKIFTVQEANDAIPKVVALFNRIFFLNERIKAVSKDMQELMDIWGEDVLEGSNPDNKFYFEKLKLREDCFEELRAKIDELHKSGCVVKDLNEGLVDFYHDNRGEMVYLCWRYGEEQIKFWHTLTGGFVGRRPLEDLKKIEEKA
ncbi:DUF2203 domain-containing protein [Candidatus Woesearchaeota archaeon]|nr:DUF2203 domain-containing protein [Candidatus Aenigmarchaeota archaeon]MBI2647456.1 DUF2203 domain-containing protein [Candidatus Woesearchaeota archaeon]